MWAILSAENVVARGFTFIQRNDREYTLAGKFLLAQIQRESSMPGSQLPVRRIVMNRRSVLASLAMGYCCAGLYAEASEDQPEIPITDCHTHFYDPSRPEGVPWPGKQDKTLYRTVLPDEFKRLSQSLGVVGTVVVEASPWLEDNQWLIDLAGREPFVRGIVGHLDIHSKTFADNLSRFARDSRYRGIRISTNDVIRGLSAGDQLLEHVKLLADSDLELDVNGGPDTPQHVAKLSAAVPRLRIVINHIGNLPIDGRAPPKAWSEAMENAAKQENVFCKVSALVEQTVTKPAPRDLEYYLPVLDHLWNVFGQNRLIFGSNWPVSDRGAPLDVLVQIVREYFISKGEKAAKKFFSENAEVVYRWPR